MSSVLLAPAAPSPTGSAGRPVRVLLAAGGTGGHVYPAIAVADAVRTLRPDAEIRFAGTAGRMEAEAVPKAGYALDFVPAVALPRALSLDLVRFPGRLLDALREARALVDTFRPDVAIGTGGYVSGPVLWAAHRAGVPVVVQEQNAYAGLTNRLLGRFAEEVHVAFDEAAASFARDKVTVSGNPVREMLFDGDRETRRLEGRARFGIPDDAPVLLAFGGSLGAQRLNEAFVDGFPRLLDALPDAHIVWATGPRYLDRVTAAVQHPRLHVVAYLDRMDLAYAAADLVVARAGAITCSELMVTGTPSVLVPSPNVADDHQTHNARALERADAAVLLPETALHHLVETLAALLVDDTRRAHMSRAARGLARISAARVIAGRALALADARAARA